ncbi:helix-turn-helix domain-containing protein [Streptomyces antioxidans]|uniref:helix-turn-helix domain-containing protein n=1 Tax=Streptomyces TaxID=1883 RepID=UPI000614524E|nr:helix-turn-helix domain-containing protein [Streptomyces antioxidans]
MRSDAASNHRRVLEAARTLFVSRGLDVPMATIARRAGVGVATLYRRFPTREALVTEVFSDEFAVCATVVAKAAGRLRSFEAGRAEPARPLPPPAPLGPGRSPRTSGG